MIVGKFKLFLALVLIFLVDLFSLPTPILVVLLLLFCVGVLASVIELSGMDEVVFWGAKK